MHQFIRIFEFSSAFDPQLVRRALVGYMGLVSFLDWNVGRILAALTQAGLEGDTHIVYTSDHGDNLGARGLWGKSTLYEESAGIPMILAGPGVPAAASCATPASLVDVFPTALACAGVDPAPADRDLPGVSLIELAKGIVPDRTVLSEYHAVGSISGATMIRLGAWKYVHFAGGRPPMLFDLDADPEEREDLGRNERYAEVTARCERVLRSLLDPDLVDERARADQRDKIAEHGGRVAILERGTFRYSPPPGGTAVRY